MKKIVIVLLVCSAMLTGCATVMNGDMVAVPVYTTPSNATVVINGTTYSSPTTVMVPRGKGNFKLHIEKDGYKPVDVLLIESVDGWVLGNILIGGLIGIVVDFASGDANDLEPELVSANLESVDTEELIESKDEEASEQNSL